MHGVGNVFSGFCREFHPIYSVDFQLKDGVVSADFKEEAPEALQSSGRLIHHRVRRTGMEWEELAPVYVPPMMYLILAERAETVDGYKTEVFHLAHRVARRAAQDRAKA